MQQRIDDAGTCDLIVNGQCLTLQARTLADVLERLGLGGSAVVAEVNGLIVQRESFTQTSLRNGDTIELVRFVGGG